MRWLDHGKAMFATKRGLAAALHSGDPAFEALPAYFDERLRPALRMLLETAHAAGEVRPDVDADQIIGAVASLSASARAGRPDQGRRTVALFVDGLRYGLDTSAAPPA